MPASAPVAADPLVDPPAGPGVDVRGYRISGPIGSPIRHYYGFRMRNYCDTSCWEMRDYGWLNEPHPTEPVPPRDGPPAACDDYAQAFQNAGCDQDPTPVDIGEEARFSSWSVQNTYGGLFEVGMDYLDRRRIRTEFNFSASSEAALNIARNGGRASCEAFGTDLWQICRYDLGKDLEWCNNDKRENVDACMDAYRQRETLFANDLPSMVGPANQFRLCWTIRHQQLLARCAI